MNKTTSILALTTVALLLPFMLTNVQADEKTPEDWINQLIGYEKYLLLTVQSLQNATDAEKVDFIKKFRDFKSSLSGYEAAYMEKINELAVSELSLLKAIENQENQKDIKKLEKQKALRMFQLEEFGITTQERHEANPDYWKQKILDAKTRIESSGTTNISHNDGTSNIYQIHQSDLALKRLSILSFPCWDSNLGQVSCPIVNYGWNAGSTTSEIWFIPKSGFVLFDHSVCLDDDTHHDEVSFEMGIERDVHSIFGTKLYGFDRDYDITLDGDEGECANSFYKKLNVYAGSRAGMTTSVSDISLD